VGFRCEGPGPLCSPCDGDWKCQPGARCETLPEGGTSCVTECDEKEGSANACQPGFTCQRGLCLPDVARFEGCHSLLRLDTPCDGDARCRDQGLTDGLCVDGACTVPCTTNRDCPGALACEDSAAGRVCRPRR
jgi:hypothetical protein